MGLCRRIGDQSFHTAKTFRILNQVNGTKNLFSKLFISNIESYHCTETTGLFFHDFITWMFLEARIDYFRDGLLFLKPFNNFYCIFLCCFHSDSKSLNSAKNKPAVKWSKASSRCLYKEPEFFLNVSSVCYDKSCKSIVVACKVFCSAVDHNIRTKFQRILKIWRQKCIVYNQENSMASCNFSKSFNVSYIHHWICRSLNVNSLCVWLYKRFNIILAAVGTGKFHAVFCSNMIKKTDGTAI